MPIEGHINWHRSSVGDPKVNSEIPSCLVRCFITLVYWLIAMVRQPMNENVIWPTAHRVVQPIQRRWALHLSSSLFPGVSRSTTGD